MPKALGTRALHSRRLTMALLGGFQVRLAAGPALILPTKKAQAVLAFLGLRPGQAYARDRLAGLLWGDTADAQARQSLCQAIYILRKTLPATHSPSLLIEGETIALNPMAVEVDAAVFERLAGEGTPEALERAAALYHGDLLEGFRVNEAPFEEWLTAERERLRELALEVFAKLLARQSTAGQTERAIQTAARLLALDPSQEVVHRALMRLYARQGRRGAALKQYQACVVALQREVGTEPEPETKQLYQEILQRQTPEPLRVNAQESGHPRGTWLERPESGREPFMRGAPLIGRESELARLREVLDQAARGHGHVVAVTGEAGIGKSSVLMALAAEAYARGVRILLGRSYHTEQVLAFGPWVDALRNGHVVADIAVFSGLAPLWRAELTRLLPELGPAAGNPLTHLPDHRRLFEGATELLRSLAAKEPVLVVLEDVHCADEMSLRLVAFLARRIRSSRILVVLSMRDEELATAPALRRVTDELGRESHFIQLALPPLTQADTTALVQSLIKPTFAADVVTWLGEQIWRASEGNPFMVVETVRAVHEGTSPHTAGTLPLPERVRRVVAGRLERLSDRGRHLVAVAAVIGCEFDFALLQHAAGLEESEAAEGVEELVRRRVLHGVGERLDFTHERVREVAYNELLQPRRKALHVLVAQALEDLYAGKLELHYAALARHYRAGEVWKKALIYLRQAGAHAMRLSAYRQAVACFEQALEVLSRLPKTREMMEVAVDLRFDLHNCLLPLAEFDKIRGYLQEAEGLASALDDQRRLGWVSVYMSRYFRMAGFSMEAVKLAIAAQSQGEVLGDFSLRLGAELYLGATCLSLGAYRRAADLFRHIVASLDDDLSRQPLGHPGFPAVLARAWLAQSLAELGEFDEGLACGKEGIRLAEAVDHPMSLTYACTRLGQLYAVKGELDRAARLLERGRGLTRDREITFTAALVASDLGHVYARLGRIAEGLSLLHDAIDAYESMKVEIVKARLLVHLGEAYLLADRLEDAQAWAGRALTHTRGRGERGYEAYALYLLAEIDSHREPPEVDTAEAHYGESMALAEELGMRPLIAHCHRGLGTLHRRAGRRQAAREYLAVAANMFQGMAMGSWLKKADAELATLS